MGKLNVWLHENPLTGDPNDCYGKVKSIGTVGLPELVNRIVEEGTELKQETIYDILLRAERIKSDCLMEGYCICTPFSRAMPKILGKFNPTESFSNEKHKVAVRFSAGSELRTTLATTKVDVLGMATVHPVISKIVDTFSGEENSCITPNNVIQLIGDRLKIVGDNHDVGVWLVNQATSSRTQCKQIIINRPKELLVMLPDVPAGNYSIEVITQYAKASILKQARKGVYEYNLTVA